jgi:hypothetical protein
MFWIDADTWICTVCRKATVDLVNKRIDPAEVDRPHPLPEETKRVRVRPLTGGRPPAASEVPGEFAKIYNEACSVLDLSPNAAAALARRCLQAVLVRRLGAPSNKTLFEQIRLVEDQLSAPVHGQLDVLRHFGNFSTHPIPEVDADRVINVEPGEADATLDILVELFDELFRSRGRRRSRLDALNAKRELAGLPPLDDPEGDSAEEPAATS